MELELYISEKTWLLWKRDELLAPIFSYEMSSGELDLTCIFDSWYIHSDFGKIGILGNEAIDHKVQGSIMHDGHC